MNRFYALFMVLLIGHLSRAGTSVKIDTIKTSDAATHAVHAAEPTYPGGTPAFGRYIGRNLEYPDAARLIGLNGNVYVSFVIDRDGKVTDVNPMTCIGAGCESAAVKVVRKSRHWKPGMQNGMPVRVNYTIPINFNMEPGKVYMDNLRASDYGFVFSIKGALYTIDEAEAILGKAFASRKVESADSFYNYNNVEKFRFPNKKVVYLVVIKPQLN